MCSLATATVRLWSYNNRICFPFSLETWGLLVAKTCNFFHRTHPQFPVKLPQNWALKTELSELARSVRWLSDTFRKEILLSPVEDPRSAAEVNNVSNIMMSLLYPQNIVISLQGTPKAVGHIAIYFYVSSQFLIEHQQFSLFSCLFSRSWSGNSSFSFLCVFSWALCGATGEWKSL